MTYITDLYLKDRYDCGLNFLSNSTIVEYDLRSANTSLAKEYDLLPKDKIKEIESLGKKDRVRMVGLIKRSDPTYHTKESAALISARELFTSINKLEDEDILFINKDAIYTTRYVDTENVTKNLEFRRKSEYTSFIRIQPLKGVTMKAFYEKEDGLKIIGMSDEVYETYHKDYFGSLLMAIFRHIERSTRKSETLRNIRNIIDQYRFRELKPEFYREFSPRSNFTYLDGETSMEEYRENLNEVDIGYNFQILNNILLYFM